MPKKPQKAPSLQPGEELVIDNLETMRVLSDPLRLQLGIQLLKPQTVKNLAKLLDVAPTKLYYHIGLLEKHGLVRVVSTRVVSGIVEKSYQVTAYRFVPKPGLISGDAAMDDTVHLFENMLESAKLEVRRAYNADLIGTPEESKSNPERMVAFTKGYFGLRPEDAKVYVDRLKAIYEEMAQASPHPNEIPEGVEMYSLTFAFHRTVNPMKK